MAHPNQKAPHLFGAGGKKPEAQKPEAAPPEPVQDEGADSAILDELEAQIEAEASAEDEQAPATDVILQDGMLVLAEPEVKSETLVITQQQVSFQPKDLQNPPPTPKTRRIVPQRTNRNMTHGGWSLCLEEGKSVPVPVECLPHLKEKGFISQY